MRPLRPAFCAPSIDRLRAVARRLHGESSPVPQLSEEDWAWFRALPHYIEYKEINTLVRESLLGWLRLARSADAVLCFRSCMRVSPPAFRWSSRSRTI